MYEPHHKVRLAIKPGITGMWQVSGRSDITDFEEVVRLDKEYIENCAIEPFINQRILAEVSGHSLGVVNRSLKELIKADYLDDSIRPTVKAITEFKQKTPQRAIILAAGFGMRMVPINTEMPKGLLEVNGEPLIERIIKQLHEVGIKEIYVVNCSILPLVVL